MLFLEQHQLLTKESGFASVLSLLERDDRTFHCYVHCCVPSCLAWCLSVEWVNFRAMDCLLLCSAMDTSRQGCLGSLQTWFPLPAVYLSIWKICKEISEIKICSGHKNSPKLYEFESSKILGNHYNWVFLPRSRKYVNTFIKSNPIFTTGGLLSWVTIHEKKGVLYMMKKKSFFLFSV